MRSSNYSIIAIISSLVIIVLVQSTIAQNSDAQVYVDAHNSARDEVGVGHVSWNETVAEYAQDYANQRIGDCSLTHSQGSPYGENIFQGSSTVYTAVDAVNLWVDEKQYYDYKSNTCASNQMCGHYTQVVWANSVGIGCARVTCNGGGVFITCNYYPPGNYVGEWPY